MEDGDQDGDIDIEDLDQVEDGQADFGDGSHGILEIIQDIIMPDIHTNGQLSHMEVYHNIIVIEINYEYSKNINKNINKNGKRKKLLFFFFLVFSFFYDSRTACYCTSR